MGATKTHQRPQSVIGQPFYNLWARPMSQVFRAYGQTESRFQPHLPQRAFLHSQTPFFNSHFHISAPAASIPEAGPSPTPAPCIIQIPPESAGFYGSVPWIPAMLSLFLAICGHLPSPAALGTPGDSTLWFISVPSNAGSPKSQSRASAQETRARLTDPAAFTQCKWIPHLEQKDG